MKSFKFFQKEAVLISLPTAMRVEARMIAGELMAVEPVSPPSTPDYCLRVYNDKIFTKYCDYYDFPIDSEEHSRMVTTYETARSYIHDLHIVNYDALRNFYYINCGTFNTSPNILDQFTDNVITDDVHNRMIENTERSFLPW